MGLVVFSLNPAETLAQSRTSALNGVCYLVSETIILIPSVIFLSVSA